MLDAGLRSGGLAIWLLVPLSAVVLAGLTVLHLDVAAESGAGETYRVRIAARLTDDQRVEFGLQQLDQDHHPVSLFLAEARFFPLSVDHERWLTGGEVVCPALTIDQREGATEPAGISSIRSAKVQIRARMHPERQQVEFGLAHQIPYERGMADDYSEVLLPERRFFPGKIAHQRWIYSSVLEFTIHYGGEQLMGGDATMEHADGGLDAGRPGPAPPLFEVTIEQCLPEFHPDNTELVSAECIPLMVEYCRLERAAIECAFLRREHASQIADLEANEP